MTESGYFGALLRDALQEDSVKSLPENQEPKPGDLPTTGFSQVTKESGHTTPKVTVPGRGNLPNCREAREAFATLDGSPTAGGLTPPPRLGQHAVAWGASRFLAASIDFQANPSGRKRAAEIGVFDDFHNRDIHQADRQIHTGLSGLASARSSPNLAAPSVVVNPGYTSEVGPQQHLPVSNSLVSPSVAEPIEQPDEEDEEPMDIAMEDKENMPLPADLQAAPTNTATVAAPAISENVVRERAPLHDLVVSELALEYEEHSCSDVESDDEEDMPSQNLADELAERVRNNVDGRYDFEIYCDP